MDDKQLAKLIRKNVAKVEKAAKAKQTRRYDPDAGRDARHDRGGWRHRGRARAVLQGDEAARVLAAPGSFFGCIHAPKNYCATSRRTGPSFTRRSTPFPRRFAKPAPPPTAGRSPRCSSILARVEEQLTRLLAAKLVRGATDGRARSGAGVGPHRRLAERSPSRSPPTDHRR